MKGRLVAAHRIAFQLLGMEIVENERVHLACGNYSCVNPEHYVWGLEWYRWKYQKTIIKKENGCWEWPNTNGDYGRMAFFGKDEGIHRISWILEYGEIPDGLCVLHRCDNPPCSRPSHLFLGTKIDNTADMVSKGRQAKGDKNGSRIHPESLPRGENHGMNTCPERRTYGERNGMAQFTERQVLEIRERFNEGEKVLKIAQDLEKSYHSIYGIVKRLKWRHI
jgi:hypothetical protein